MINILGESYILATRLEARGTAKDAHRQTDRRAMGSEGIKHSLSLFQQVRTWFFPQNSKLVRGTNAEA